MLFQGRIERAFKYLSKKTGKDHSDHPEKEYDPKMDREGPELMDIMEKGDTFAMIFSALITLLPICLILLLVIVGLAKLVFHM